MPLTTLSLSGVLVCEVKSTSPYSNMTIQTSQRICTVSICGETSDHFRGLLRAYRSKRPTNILGFNPKHEKEPLPFCSVSFQSAAKRTCERRYRTVLGHFKPQNTPPSSNLVLFVMSINRQSPVGMRNLPDGVALHWQDKDRWTFIGWNGYWSAASTYLRHFGSWIFTTAPFSNLKTFLYGQKQVP